MKLSKILGGIAAGILLSVNISAFAEHDELVIKSSIDGQDAFLIVYDSPKARTPTDLDLGIYTFRRGTERPQLVFKGDILGAGRSFNGILTQLNMTRVTQRYESIAVVNGQIVIFSNKSKKALPSSYIALGSKANPVLDVLNRRPVNIEPIEDIRNINVALGPLHLGEGYQLALFSIKQGNVPFGGKGLTIAALVVKPTAGEPISTLSLASQPVVIDYDFYSSQELQRLFHSGYRDLVLSPSHLLHFTTAHQGDDQIVEEWRANLSSVLKRVKKDRTEVKKKVPTKKPGTTVSAQERREATIPYYDMILEQVHLDRVPYALIAKAPLMIYQFTNPVSGNGSGLFIFPENSVFDESQIQPGATPTVPGRIDFDDKTRSYKISKIEGEEPAVFASIEGKAHLIFQINPTRITSVDISNIFSGDYKNVQGYFWSVAETDHSGHFKHYFFISVSHRGGGYDSEVLVIDERDGITKYERRLPLNKRFMSAKEIRNRVYGSTSENDISHNVILFDDITSAERALRGRKLEITTPLLNVTETRRTDNVVQTYLRSIGNHEIVENQLEYRLYDPKGAKSPQSGFYMWKLPNPTGKPDVESQFVAGEILFPENDKTASITLDAKMLKHVILADKSTAPQFRISAIAFNPEPGRKAPEGRFSLMIHAGPASEYNSVSSGYTNIEISGPIERLVGAKLVQGRKLRGLNVSLLLFFKSDSRIQDPKRANRGGVISVNFDIDSGQLIDMKSRVKNVRVNWLEREEVRPDQIRHRIVWDTPGDVYWILNPEKEIHDRNYKVKKLLAPEEDLYPNQAGRRIPLRYDQGMDEDEDFESLYRTQSRWLIYHKQDLSDTFPVLKGYFEELEKKKEKDDGKKSKERVLFPNFENFLDSLAVEKGPSTHQVLLVEAAHKDTFLKIMARSLAERKHGAWSFDNMRFSLYGVDTKVDDKEMRDELDKIAKKARDGRNLLVADLGDMLAAQQIEVAKLQHDIQAEEADGDTSDQPDPLEEGETKSRQLDLQVEKEAEVEENEGDADNEDNSFKTSMMMVLASEGDRVPLKYFRGNQPKKANRIPMLIIATPAEYRALRTNFEDEEQAGVFNTFQVNTQFLTSSWSMWAPESGKATEEVAKAAQAPISPDEYQVFPNLETQLLDSAKQNGPRKHHLIVVPEELKSLVRRLVLARWATDSKAMVGPWSHTNPNLALSQVNSNQISQELISENFDALRGATHGRRPTLIADMGDLIRIGRPLSTGGAQTSFYIKDPASAKAPVNGFGDQSSATPVLSRQIPHIVWWLAAEGKKIQPQKSKSWRIENDAAPEIPMLIFASPTELAQLNADTEFESRFAPLEKQFEISHLDVPPQQIREKLINELFNQPRIAALDYSFKHNDLSSIESRKQLIGIMVNRVEQIATGGGQEPTAAFLKAYLELKRQLTEDPKLRQERVIDRYFFERLYRRVFNMPLSFDILTKDDPLMRLKDPDRASIGLQEIGYEGSNQLKKEIIETITSQTKGADEGRPIPSSTILIGDTSTGKTFLFKKVIELMKLKIYDFGKPADEQASAFIVNLGTISDEDDPANPGRMSVKKVIQHLENFLSLPNGLRGFVLIDDAHKGSPAVRKAIIQYLQGFFELPGGMKRVQRMNDKKEVFEIPVRNLNLFMTLNPQPNKEIRDKYVDEWKEDIDKDIIAALAGDDVQIDGSFVARWSTKLNLDKFPREAKIPTLVTRIRNAASQEFSSHPRLMLVTPPVLDKFVTRFPDANAREFLSAATFGVLSLDSDLPEAPIFLVMPNREIHESEIVRDTRRGKEKINASELRKYLKEITVVRPVRANEIGSQVYLTSFMIDGFRAHVYNWMVTASQRLPDLSSTRQLRTRDMAAFILGVIDNLVEFPSVPISQVRVQPNELISNPKPGQIAEYNEAVAKNSAKEKNFFRFNFQSSVGEQHISLDQFIGSNYSPARRGRLDVLAETAGQAEVILSKLLGAYFRVGNVNGNLDLDLWVQGLTDKEPKEDFFKAAEQLVGLYTNFGQRLFENDLKEMAKGSGYGHVNLTDYDKVRLFMMCIDKALTQLPWGRMTRFAMSAIDKSVKDQAWGMKPALQHFFFKSNYSPAGTLTPELVYEVAAASSDYRDFKEEAGTQLRGDFVKKCDSILINEEKER